MSKHHLLPDIQSLDSSALLFTDNHITARSMLVAERSRNVIFNRSFDEDCSIKLRAVISRDWHWIDPKIRLNDPNMQCLRI